MTEINLSTAKQADYDPRPQYFVKMFKDGSYTAIEIPKGKEELDQSTMELEYLPQLPSEEEKIEYALTLPEITTLGISDDLKRQIAQQLILKDDFSMPVFDPNSSRVHTDPEYFFKVPCKPVIWTWKRGSQEDAVAEAEKYRQKMLSSGKWDIVVKVYKEQYNLVEV